MHRSPIWFYDVDFLIISDLGKCFALFHATHGCFKWMLQVVVIRIFVYLCFFIFAYLCIGVFAFLRVCVFLHSCLRIRVYLVYIYNSYMYIQRVWFSAFSRFLYYVYSHIRIVASFNSQIYICIFIICNSRLRVVTCSCVCEFVYAIVIYWCL